MIASDNATAYPIPRFTIIYCTADGSAKCSPNISECKGSVDATKDAVLDNLTGLLWLRDANHNPGGTAGKDTWANQGTYITDTLNNTSKRCGYTDWRMPTRAEFASLVDDRYSSPAIPNTAGTAKWTANAPFVNLQNSRYWSSTTFAGDTTYAWFVTMTYGYVDAALKTNSNYTLPVRSGL
ncbi:protein containing DUF1566 [Candidatus Magnetobacterium bavaricum]|uniref:Protein containing DUF1566 n=1 Tax=Candidatus Magnetobacterium bavaricum TaxID=29290 RepID=A0A0F3GR50_9BACT|nr:protein containing DUF1566 [Candidatus Magnetobacterium bavaricum]